MQSFTGSKPCNRSWITRKLLFSGLIFFLSLLPLAAILSAATAAGTAWVPATNTPFLFTRFDAEFSTTTNKIYFLGGRLGDGNTDGSVWSYDPVTGVYADTGVDMPVPVSNYIIARLIDSVGTETFMIFGGRTQAAVTTNTVQGYIPATNTTIDLTATDPYPVVTAPGGVQVVNNIAYVFGGFDGVTMIAATNIFDINAPAGTRWTAGPPLSLARSYIATGVIDGVIYAAGGATFDGTNLFAQTIVEKLDTNIALTWDDAGVADMPIACDEMQGFAFDTDSPYDFAGKFVTGGCGQWPAEIAESMEYDAATNTWDQSFPNLNNARRNHAGAFIPISPGFEGVPGMWVWGGRQLADTTILPTPEYFSVGIKGTPPGCPASLATYTNNTPVPITDAGVTTSVITVAGALPYLWNVNLQTFIQHTFPGDLDITLQSPAGTVVTITTDNGGGSDNVFDGTIFKDYANPGGQVPYTNNNGLVTDQLYVNAVTATPLVPEEAMAAFIGENPNGDWLLTISDDTALEIGTLNAWSIQLVTLTGPPTAASSFVSNVTPVVIPDNTTVTSTINVSGLPTFITDINSTTFIQHTFPGDIDMTLQSPAGTVVTLTTDNGSNTANAFNGTFWDDNANPGGQVPYVNNNGLVTDQLYAVGVVATPLVPEEALGAFIGEDPNGTWTLTISDDAGGDTGSLDMWSLIITYGNCCNPITLSPPTLPGGTTGVAYSQTITASGGTAPYTFAVTNGALPTGLTLNATTGVISGTPTTTGPFPFDITATDANGCTGVQTYNIDIACPVITVNPAALPDGTVGVAYSQTVTGSGGTAPYTFAVTGSVLPPGLTLSTAGLISGTPTTSGSFDFDITATDNNGCTGVRTYTLDICPVITLDPPTLPDGTVGTPYSVTVGASGGAAPYTFAVTSGTFPSGLSLNPTTGEISGTPSLAGTFNFQITATDSNGCTGAHAYTLIVNCPGMTVDPATLPDGQQGVAYSQTVTANGGTAPYVFAVTAGALPAGLTLDPNTGVISGTPSAIETATFTITAVDSLDCSASTSYTVNIVTACLFCDEFDDATVNPAWTYNHITDWSESGTLLTANAPKKSFAIASVFVGCDICSITTTIATTDDLSKASFFGWYIDKKHNLEAMFKFKADRIVIKQRNGTTAGKQKVVFTLDPNTTYTVTMTNDGTNVVLNINGTDVATFTTVGPLPVGTIGYKVVGNTSFDYIHVN